MDARKTIAFILLALAGSSLSGGLSAAGSKDAVAGRGTVLFNEGWRYLEDPVERVEALRGKSGGWREISLPHTWNALDVVDPVPGYRRSASWYEHSLTIPSSLGSSRVILAFEGVNISCRVYVNGNVCGGHVGGYVGFDVDITGALNKGKNIIDIRVDNSINRDIIPSQKSDFFIYGGISRNVRLKVVAPQYIERLLVIPHGVDSMKAATAMDVLLVNTGHAAGSLGLDVVVANPSGVPVLQKREPISANVGTGNFRLELPELERPSLWSPETPSLYTAVVRLMKGSVVLDSVTERYGYRWFKFKPNDAFYLNGRRLLLRGTQRHEEYAGIGNAVPDSLQRRDIELAKGMGANFLRLAHYPQAPAVYRACDELGIIVWDELPWCRGGVGGETWKENTKRLLGEQINRNFNHPSIFLWSLGNEIYMEPEFRGADNSDSISAFLRELNALAHRLDPSRVTSIRKYYDGADIPDVFSPSVWSGWYGGAYFDYEKAITEAHEKYPRLFHAEYGGDSHPGRHTESPVTGDGFLIPDGADSSKKTKIKNVSVSGDWSENYIVNLFDWHLHVSEQLPWFAGNAQWILKDFATPLRPENPIPYVNEKGLLERNGNPKDAYYVYKSRWTTDPKFCYIESHTWTERSGPAGVKRTVKIFSNCDQVELSVGGVSLGKKLRDTAAFPACGLAWPVEFKEGENTLIAAGYAGVNVVCADTLAVRYSYHKAGEADHIELTSAAAVNGRVLVTATAVDKNGRRNLEYSKRVYFTSEGGGTLVRDQGTPAGSAVIEMANGVARIEYIPDRAIPGVVECRNQDFKGEYLRMEPVSGAQR